MVARKKGILPRTSPAREEVQFDRSLRSEENRQHEVHQSDRADFNFGELISQFNIPPQIQARFPDHVLGFVMYRSNNEEQRENYDAAIRRRWQPVLQSEIAEYYEHDYLSPFERGEKGSDQLVRRGGQVMMKRLKIHHNAEASIWQRKAQDQMEIRNSFDGNTNLKPIFDRREPFPEHMLVPHSIR